MKNKFKIGDFVTRKKYNHDIIFRIEKITDNEIILHGMDVRLYATSTEDDLVLSSIPKINEELEEIRDLKIEKYFYIPGTILHLDADENYLKKCEEYYKNQKLKYYAYKYSEKEFKNVINKLIEKHSPNIVVITGHDAYFKNEKYKNSNYFIETVKEIKKEYKDIIIIAGACQSDYEGLIKAGSTFASSPSKINVHALDPAIIASYIALSENDKTVDLEKMLEKTKYGSNGYGGLIISGIMKKGYPRIKK